MSDMLTLMIIMNMLSIMFFYMNHPLSKGLILMIQTILVSIISGLMNFNFWFSYIIFLIMIGGMLILFIYMTSIASNEKFKWNLNTLIIIISLISTLILISNFIDYFYTNKNMKTSELMNQMYLFNNNFSLIKYFNFPNNFLMMMMIIYLFITLIAIVKITKFSYGPLRQKF